ncbi:S1 domain-containing protein, partial [Acinetobacter baumannii]
TIVTNLGAFDVLGAAQAAWVPRSELANAFVSAQPKVLTPAHIVQERVMQVDVQRNSENLSIRAEGASPEKPQLPPLRAL